MMRAALVEEMDLAAARLRRHHFERIRDLGCPWEAIARLTCEQHTIGVARIEPQAGGLFVFAEAGGAAIIQAVVDPYRELVDEGISDLLAWFPDDPLRWWWRVGTAWALGDELLDGDHPVPVVPTPLAWLASAGQSLVILDWLAPASCWSALRGGPPLTFADNALRLRVRNALVRSAPMPTMEISHAC